MTEVTTPKGKKRVRLGSSTLQRPDKNRLKAMDKGRKKSLKKAERRDNGKAIRGYKYKAVLDGYRENGLEPHIYNGVPQKTRTTVPLFEKDPRIGNQIVKFIRAGYPYTTVCRYVGVSRNTFMSWLEKGKANYSPSYSNFYKRVARAEARAEMRTLKKLRQHENADWRVSAWQLERRWPEHWGKRDAVQAELKVNATLNIDNKESLGSVVVNDEEARALARKMIEGDEFGYQVVDEQETEDA